MSRCGRTLLAVLCILTAGACADMDGPDRAVDEVRPANVERDGPDCFSDVCVADIPDALTAEAAGVILDGLARDLATSGAAPVACHRVAHAVGRAAGRGGADLSALLELYDGQCSGGYLHGVFQAYGENGDLTAITARGSALCRSGDVEGYRVVADCVHGLGHEFAIASGTDIAAGVLRCDALDLEDREECAGGVLMEHYQRAAFDPDRLDAAFCATLPDGPYQAVCHGQRWAAALRAGTDPAAYAMTCTGPHSTMCGRGLGYLVAYRSATTLEALRTCATIAAGGFIDACTYGVVAVAFEAAGWDGDPAAAVPTVCPEDAAVARRCQAAASAVHAAAGA